MIQRVSHVAFLYAAALVLWSGHLAAQRDARSFSLIDAIRNGKLDLARKLVNSGTNLNVGDENGNTPLKQAISGGYTSFAEELLTAGANPNFVPKRTGTPLMIAAWNCNLEITKKLLNAGALVNLADMRGETALMGASGNCRNGAIVQMLLDHGANANALTDEGFTALLSAARGGQSIAAEELIKAGADPAVKDKYGHTAEGDACDRGEEGRSRVCALVRAALKEH